MPRCENAKAKRGVGAFGIGCTPVPEGREVRLIQCKGDVAQVDFCTVDGLGPDERARPRRDLSRATPPASHRRNRAPSLTKHSILMIGGSRRSRPLIACRGILTLCPPWLRSPPFTANIRESRATTDTRFPELHHSNPNPFAPPPRLCRPPGYR